MSDTILHEIANAVRLNNRGAVVITDNSTGTGTTLLIAGVPDKSICVYWMYMGGTKDGIPGALWAQDGTNTVFNVSCRVGYHVNQFFNFVRPWCLTPGANLNVYRTSVFGAANVTVGYGWSTDM